MTSSNRRTAQKNILLFLILLISQNPLSATGIHFEKSSFSALLKKAAKEKKMVFLECCTTWCPPCRRMEKNVYPNDTVGDFYNSHFICAVIDVEKGEGITLAKQYEIGCYPTYLFIDENGNLMHRQSGECSVADFVAIGNAALTPALQFGPLDRKCMMGKATSDEMLLDLKVRKASYMSIDSVLEIYMQAQPDANLSNSENWSLANRYMPPPSNHFFRYLLDHQQEYVEKYSRDSVDLFVQKVYGIAMSLATSPYGTIDTAKYRMLRNEYVNRRLPNWESATNFYDMDYYIAVGNPNAFAKTACAYLRNANDSDSQLIDYITWKFYHQSVTDTASLDTIISLAAKSAAYHPNYYTTRNYSQLLFNRGRNKEAEAQAKLAIQFADKDGMDASEEKELLRKIRSMK